MSPLSQWSTRTFDDGNWGGSVNAVPTQSKHADAALLFAAWINTDAQAIHYAVLPADTGGRGLWPAGTYALNTPALQAPDPELDGQRAAGIFIPASKAVDTRFQCSPWTNYFASAFGVQVDKAVKGQESWTQALANTATAVSQFAQQQGYTVTH